jgi:hypothetical protein
MKTKTDQTKENKEYVLKNLESLADKIKKQKEILDKTLENRKQWCLENRKKIKSIYPIKNKIYEVINNKIKWEKNCNWAYTWRLEELKKQKIYFKPTYTNWEKMYPDEIYPKIKGIILDETLKEIENTYFFFDYSFFYNGRIRITDLKKGNVKNNDDKITKVYVMIDKNTGYYKIGRSLKPKFREKTLQSEKPTIELLFSNDAKIKKEKDLHNMFSDKRIRGEWFDLNGSDLTKIKEYLNVDQI